LAGTKRIQGERAAALEKVDGAYTPGVPTGQRQGQTLFVAGDTLSFRFTAMVRDDDNENREGNRQRVSSAAPQSQATVASSEGITTSKR